MIDIQDKNILLGIYEIQKFHMSRWLLHLYIGDGTCGRYDRGVGLYTEIGKRERCLCIVMGKPHLLFYL